MNNRSFLKTLANWSIRNLSRKINIGKIELDRTKWNINYGSKTKVKGFNEKIKSMVSKYKDKLIKDFFELKFDIYAKDVF